MKTIYIAIPALDEKDYLFQTLDCIVKQQCEYSIKVFICINQPDSWWEDEKKSVICKNNQETIDLLKDYDGLTVECIDYSSRGKGWQNEKQGVGHARKELIQQILSVASDDDILISMDADTIFEPDYCQTIVENFRLHPSAVGMAVPYCHKMNDSEIKNRAMLRYELYMRNYNLHLLRIGSPYAYTALGSAIACTIKACKAVGGFDTHISGEDFYFLQKLAKYGNILTFNSSKVYPATRFSNRVPFGTGPAIYKGSQGDFSSYPIFHYSGFDIIKQVYDQIDRLFHEDFDNEFLHFLNTIFSSTNIWEPLRKNYKTLPLFTKAFHTKADGLRIFQFLRQYQHQLQKTDEECFIENINYLFSEQSAEILAELQIQPNNSSRLDYKSSRTLSGICNSALKPAEDLGASFEKLSIQQLDNLRNFFMEQETIYQKQSDINLLYNKS
jgi:cellulose synthase/poly-beta-1,6-N-acetylglucosamine synthase-like glycosyltransferase